MRILQIDGGGIKGIIPAMILSQIEATMNKPIHKIFDLITGTSTGAILGGCCSVGVPAQAICDAYVNDGPMLFNKRPIWNPLNWFRDTYDRKPFLDMIQEFIGDKHLSDAKTKLILTTFGCCAQKTHFIKSTNAEDAKMALIDAIALSALSAVKYFGAIKVPDYSWDQRRPDMIYYRKTGEVFQDGGQGINNCTLGYDIFEILANKWEDEDIFILSLGTGDFYEDLSFKKESSDNLIQQIIQFVSQARNESTNNFIDAATFISDKRPNFKFCRLNVVLPKKQDELDAIKYIPDFVNYGNQLCKKIPWELLK